LPEKSQQIHCQLYNRLRFYNSGEIPYFLRW
jgi:hypothetical protein